MIIVVERDHEPGSHTSADEGDAMRSAAKETTRDCLVDTDFEDAGLPAREDVAAVELEVGGHDDIVDSG